MLVSLPYFVNQSFKLRNLTVASVPNFRLAQNYWYKLVLDKN